MTQRTNHFASATMPEMSQETLEAIVRSLMQRNQRRTDHFRYTLPSPELYPFQWLWDSCFHALIYNTLGETAQAQHELRAACAKPLPGGLIPHIIYWERPENGAQWGRERRSDVLDAAWGHDNCSTITQPPLLAHAVYDTVLHGGDITWLAEMFPILDAHYEALRRTRQFDDTELLMIINPDESGEDNSPRFDTLLELPPHHSADQHLNARITLLHEHAACRYEVRTCMRDVFAVVDTGFNLVYFDALRCMEALAGILHQPDTAARYRARADELASDLRLHLYDGEHWYAYDATHNRPIPVATWNTLLPLWAGIVTDEEAVRLVEALRSPHAFASPYGIRTTAKHEPSYDPHDGFWRGPIWPAPHWFLFHGLRRYGYEADATRVANQLERLVCGEGFREHYHPETGIGLGAHNFTWGGLILTMQPKPTQ